MDVDGLGRQFARMGARVRVQIAPPRRNEGDVALDIVRDRQGERFEMRVAPQDPPDVQVLHCEPRVRHLLLMTRDSADQKHKFLCGHDERHWFVAAIPENRSVSTVQTAMEALKPARIQRRQANLGVPTKLRQRRRNPAFVRQGEWFFVPVESVKVPEWLILRDEPLRRGGGKPHRVEFLYRTGGRRVYVCRQFPNGLTEAGYREQLLEQPASRQWNWQSLVRDPEVYVRGRVRHADHATIELPGWHRVLMNTEAESVAMRHVAFLD